MRTAIDTNVLSALFNAEPDAERIAQTLFDQRKQGSLHISSHVYAELAVQYDPNDLSTSLSSMGIDIDLSTTPEILATAAGRWRSYLARRQRGEGHYPCPRCGHVNTISCDQCHHPLGRPKLVLVDFLVGADALHKADALVTLDRGIYATYFPDLTVVTWAHRPTAGSGRSPE